MDTKHYLKIQEEMLQSDDEFLFAMADAMNCADRHNLWKTASNFAVGLNTQVDEDDIVSQEEIKVVCSMLRVYGGGFMEMIGKALEKASPLQAAMVKKVWSVEWSTYLNFSDYKK